MAVRVITDSSAGLPPEVCSELRIDVVPLVVTAGGRSGEEGLEVTTDDVIEALEAKLPVRTSRPTPAAFARVFASVAGEEVVAIHLSGELSGTAEAAAAALGEQGEVLDSRTCGMGLGHVVIAAAQVARAGGSRADVVAAATTAMRRTHVYFYVESLDALRRGGRIGAAAAMVGGALAVKPLLQVREGAVHPLEKVRTASRALARLQAVAEQVVGRGGCDVAVMHLGAFARADHLAVGLKSALPGVVELRVTELSAAVGAHTGVGALGIAVTERVTGR
jgi:DegV family protein with EDD domain